MPRYTSKRRRSVQRNVARIKKSVSRDRRRMLHWAARGTHADYDKLRKHAKKVVDRTPSYVDAAHVQDIADKGSRRHLAERVHDSSFLDSLAWLIDQVPGGSWNWIKQAAQGALKPFRGDDINEQDEVYALLLDQAYKDDPKDHMGQWVRVPELGSDYVQVFDSPDQHRYVAVRGRQRPQGGRRARRRARSDQHRGRRAPAHLGPHPAGHHRRRGRAQPRHQPHRKGL